MKPALISLVALVLCAGCRPGTPSKVDRYEFHPGWDGKLMWRCDRETGEVTFCKMIEPYWVKVADHAPPENRSTGLFDDIIQDSTSHRGRELTDEEVGLK